MHVYCTHDNSIDQYHYRTLSYRHPTISDTGSTLFCFDMGLFDDVADYRRDYCIIDMSEITT